MVTRLPDTVTREEETAFSDVANLIAEARGEGPVEGRSPVQLSLGRWDTAPLLRGPRSDSLIEDCRRLAADEVYIRVMPDEDPPVAVAIGGSPRAASHAAYLFLERVLGFGFFLVGDQIPDLRKWRPSPFELRTRPALPYRLYLNHPFFAGPWRYCCRLWGEEEWKHTVDWLRRKRYTHMVCYHDEGGHLWGRAFGDAFPQARTRDGQGFVMDPERRTDLNRQVFRYAQDSGIGVAYRLMYSVLPQSFANIRSDLLLHPQPTDAVSICPGEPECSTMMERFWAAILEAHPPAQGQLYLVSPYGHRQRTCEHVRDRTLPALDAVRILSDLDPDGRVFVDAPNAPDAADNAREWASLSRALPPEVGVIDWDSGLRDVADWGGLAGGERPWMPVLHLSRTGCYPPAGVTAKDHDLRAVWSAAAAGGACGVIAVNVLANTSSYLSDCAAELGWKPSLDPDQHRLDYATRRYSLDAAQAMAQAYDRMAGGFVPELALPLSPHSMEQVILRTAIDGRLDREWIREQERRADGWLECACVARSLARSGGRAGEADVPARFMQETSYVEWRALGILALLRSHLASTPQEASQLVYEAAHRLRVLAGAYDRPDLRIADIPLMARAAGVRLTRWFLSDLRGVGAGSSHYSAKAGLIPALEDFPQYEAAVLAAAPEHAREGALRLLQGPS